MPSTYTRQAPHLPVLSTIRGVRLTTVSTPDFLEASEETFNSGILAMGSSAGLVTIFFPGGDVGGLIASAFHQVIFSILMAHALYSGVFA